MVVSLDQQNLLSISLNDFQGLDLANLSADFLDTEIDTASPKEHLSNVGDVDVDLEEEGRKYKKFGNFVLIDCQKD